MKKKNHSAKTAKTAKSYLPTADSEKAPFQFRGTQGLSALRNRGTRTGISSKLFCAAIKAKQACPGATASFLDRLKLFSTSSRLLDGCWMAIFGAPTLISHPKPFVTLEDISNTVLYGSNDLRARGTHSNFDAALFSPHTSVLLSRLLSISSYGHATHQKNDGSKPFKASSLHTCSVGATRSQRKGRI